MEALHSINMEEQPIDGAKIYGMLALKA